MKDKNESYKWRKSCVLTPTEGEKLESEVLPSVHCDNVSQLLKKIIRKELTVNENVYFEN